MYVHAYTLKYVPLLYIYYIYLFIIYNIVSSYFILSFAKFVNIASLLYDTSNIAAICFFIRFYISD